MRTLKLTHQEIELIERALDSQFWEADKLLKSNGADGYLTADIRAQIRQESTKFWELSGQIKSGDKDV